MSPHTAVDRSPWVEHNCLKSMEVDLRRGRVRFGQDCTLGLEFVLVQEEEGWVPRVVLNRYQHKLVADWVVGGRAAAVGNSTMLWRDLLAVAGRVVHWE